MGLRTRSLLQSFLGLWGIGSLGGCIEWECQQNPTLPDCHRLDVAGSKIRDQSTLSGRVWGPLLPQALHAHVQGAEFRIEQGQAQCPLKKWEVDEAGGFSFQVSQDDLRRCQKGTEAELVVAASGVVARHPITLALASFDTVTPVVLQLSDTGIKSGPPVWAGAQAPRGPVFVLRPEGANQHRIDRYRLVGSTLERLEASEEPYLQAGEVTQIGLTAEHLVVYTGNSTLDAWHAMGLTFHAGSQSSPAVTIFGNSQSQLAADPGGDLILIASPPLPPDQPLYPESSLIARRGINGAKIALPMNHPYGAEMLQFMMVGRLDGSADTVSLLVRSKEQRIDVLRLDEQNQMLALDEELTHGLNKSLQEKTKSLRRNSLFFADVGAVGDIDGDGKNELILLRSDPSDGNTQTTRFVQRLLIVWNALSKQPGVEVRDLPNFALNSGEVMVALSIADLDGDARLDLLVTTGKRYKGILSEGRIWLLSNPLPGPAKM